MFDSPRVLTCYGLCPCEKPEHKHIVGIQFVGKLSIRESFGIAIELEAQHNAVCSQRVANRVRTIQVDRTRGCQCRFPKGFLRIHSRPLKKGPRARKGKCMPGQHATRIDR